MGLWGKANDNKLSKVGVITYDTVCAAPAGPVTDSVQPVDPNLVDPTPEPPAVVIDPVPNPIDPVVTVPDKSSNKMKFNPVGLAMVIITPIIVLLIVLLILAALLHAICGINLFRKCTPKAK